MINLRPQDQDTRDQDQYLMILRPRPSPTPQNLKTMHVFGILKSPNTGIAFYITPYTHAITSCFKVD